MSDDYVLNCRLTYGLDYEGNVCGSKHRHRDLNQLELRYWLNPNQVYESGLKDGEVKLANARTICLLDCPEPSDDTLNWVCDYPDGEIRLKMNDWIDRNYDYFEFLTPEMRNSSLQLQGPCYPVIFPSVNGKSASLYIYIYIYAQILSLFFFFSFCYITVFLYSLLELPIHCSCFKFITAPLAADGWCEYSR